MQMGLESMTDMELNMKSDLNQKNLGKDKKRRW